MTNNTHECLVLSMLGAIKLGDLKTVKKIINDGYNLTKNGPQLGQGLILDACEYGHEHIVRYLVKETGVSISFDFEDHQLPLHSAVLSNNLTLIKYLIEEEGAEMGLFLDDNPLNTVSFDANYTNRNEELLMYLIKAGLKESDLEHVKENLSDEHIPLLKKHLLSIKPQILEEKESESDFSL